MKTFKIGLNRQFSGKPFGKIPFNSAENWEPLEVNCDQLIEFIQKGYAISAQFKDGYRNTRNFLSSQFLAADIDGGLSIEEAKKVDFIKDNCAFLYTTASHTDEFHRFRLVFLLDETIQDSRMWADSLLGLSVKLNSDRSISDSARMFYGNPNSLVIRFDRLLDPDQLSTLSIIGSENRLRSKTVAPIGVSLASRSLLKKDMIIRCSDGSSKQMKNIETGESVYCPFHVDMNPSAFVVKSGQGSSGVHCRTCRITYWTDKPSAYDFDRFDTLIERKQSGLNSRSEKDIKTFFDQFFPPKPRLVVHQKRFLPSLAYQEGITLIKSPKGSGKTEALKALVNNIRKGEISADIARHEKPKSILLIGHRQSLIKEAAKKLGISCYLDNPDFQDRAKGFAICLDSLHKVVENRKNFYSKDGSGHVRQIIYDVVILDESEQVISHLLSETIGARAGFERIFHSLKFVLGKAKSIYALDADLGLITTHSLKAFRPDFWQDKCSLIVNKPLVPSTRRSINLYKKKKELEKHMLDSIRAGRKCFVCSNSKETIKTLDKIIEDEFGSEVKKKSITSDNSRQKSEREFIENIREKILDLDVLLCSPSLGTGIDLSFPDGKSEIDEVIGFFNPYVNTHMDIDQQLSRVRNPGNVSVWFETNRMTLESDHKVIQDEIGQSFSLSGLIEGYDDDGKIVYNHNHPLLVIFSHVISSQRSSRNKLLELFIELRKQYGWDVLPVDQDSGYKSRFEQVKKKLKSEFIDLVLNSKTLIEEDYLELCLKEADGLNLSDAERASKIRGDIERALNIDVDRQIAEEYLNNNLINKIQMFRSVFHDDFSGRVLEQISDNIRKSEYLIPFGNELSVLLSILSLTNLVSADGFHKDLSIKNDDLSEFVKLLEKNKVIIEETTKVSIRSDFKSNPVRQLNMFLDLFGIALIKGKRSRASGKLGFEYALDKQKLGLMEKLSKSYVSKKHVAR